VGRKRIAEPEDWETLTFTITLKDKALFEKKVAKTGMTQVGLFRKWIREK
jgi:hypothetical protein